MPKQTQERQVIEALKSQGGWATLRRLNEVIDFSKVENCQLLGFAKGDRKDSALKTLILENPWIIECGFDISKITGVRVIRE